jgi:hypothetical protein
MRKQCNYTHESGLAGPGSGGVKGKPEIEKRQVVRELQILPGETEAGTEGRNHAKVIGRGPIETMIGSAEKDSCLEGRFAAAPVLTS